MGSTYLLRATLVLSLTVGTAGWSMAQEESVSTPARSFSGAVTVTNNGISTIPLFTLGKPAAIFDLSVAGKRLSFEPQFRFDIEGARPWVFLLWWRYKVLQRPKFQINLAANPALSFVNRSFETDTGVEKVIWMRRFLASELRLTYTPEGRFSLGASHQYSHGIERNTNRHLQFTSINVELAGVPLSDRWAFSLYPSAYYLRMDGVSGYYVTSRLTLVREGFPISLHAIANKSIHTRLAGADFLWNVSAVYAFVL